MTRTFNFKLVWLIMGALLLLEALFMLLSTGVARLYDEADVYHSLFCFDHIGSRHNKSAIRQKGGKAHRKA